MALDASRLSQSMRANWDTLQPIPPGLTDEEKAAVSMSRDELCQAFANAIVVEIVANTQVHVTSVGFVQTGTGTSGPGTGTVT